MWNGVAMFRRYNGPSLKYVQCIHLRDPDLRAIIHFIPIYMYRVDLIFYLTPVVLLQCLFPRVLLTSVSSLLPTYIYFPGYRVDFNVYFTSLFLTAVFISARIVLNSMFISPQYC